MSSYKPTWDLSTIPDPEWNSEHGRRNRLKGPLVTRENVQPCAKCGTKLNKTERRSPCPKCGWKNSRRVQRDGKWIELDIPYTESRAKR